MQQLYSTVTHINNTYIRKVLKRFRFRAFFINKDVLAKEKKTAVTCSPSAPRVGLEPTTPRLTAVCSTIELSGNIH